LTARTAREHVRIARRFSRGELSFAKVRALTRIAEDAAEEELIELARHLTAAQLERAVRAYRHVTTEEADAVQDAAYVDWYWDEDGSLVLRGRLAPEDGAVLVQASTQRTTPFGREDWTRRAVPRNRVRRTPRPSWQLRMPPCRRRRAIARLASVTRWSFTSTPLLSRSRPRAAARSPKARRWQPRRRAGSPAIPRSPG
jgi:hypothetical protein